MVPFEEILKALGPKLDAHLHVDKNGACKIQIPDKLPIQLEPDTKKDELLMATFICEIPPGKFRENILKDALKANEASTLEGTLSFCERINQLALFSYLPFSELTGEKLHVYLLKFIDKAMLWHKAVETGQTTPLAPAAKIGPSNPFGLKP